MPQDQTLKQLQSRKRKLERELATVSKNIAKLRDFESFMKLSKKLTVWNSVVISDVEFWSESLCKRFAGGFYRVKHANGTSSLYSKTKTGIVWHHTYARGKYNWVRVNGQ